MRIKSFSPALVSRLLDRWQPSESIILIILALFVGLAGGTGVWIFKQLIDLSHFLMFGKLGVVLSCFGRWTVAFLPMIGGLFVGLAVHFLIGKERYHGVAGIMESVALAGGRLQYRKVPAKAAAAALSIGSGASVGPEDPSVQIGTNIGSMFGQLFRLSDERIRMLVAAGAAAGISAAFNAPIAGVFFSMEIILGEISGNAFGIVMLAAVSSSVFTQAISGTQPAFHVSAYAFNSVWELPLYLGLGLLAGSISALYIRLLYTTRDLFHRLTIPQWLKPAIAGLCVGLIGIILPQVFGVGYETIEEILRSRGLEVGLLIALLAAKLVLTPASIGGGFPGGVFAPSLFLGATSGAAYGIIVGKFFPVLGIFPPAFAMVGMAAVLAGSVHAPLTAIILLFEMTHDYRIILPLMLAVTVSLFISQRLQRDSVYTMALTKKGIRIQRGRDIEVLDALMVNEVMLTNIPTLHEFDSLSTASDLFTQYRSHGLPVVNDIGELIGILTVQDIERVQDKIGEDGKDYTVGEVCIRELLVAYPDETLSVALQRMSVRDIGRLPVVSRDNPRRLLGVLRRSDLIRAYDIALTRRAETRHKAYQRCLNSIGGINIEEIIIKNNASCIDCCINEIIWPRDCIIATIRRGSRIFIPNGDTVLKEGDVLTVVAGDKAREDVHHICLGLKV